MQDLTLNFPLMATKTVNGQLKVLDDGSANADFEKTGVIY